MQNEKCRNAKCKNAKCKKAKMQTKASATTHKSLPEAHVGSAVVDLSVCNKMCKPTVGFV